MIINYGHRGWSKRDMMPVKYCIDPFKSSLLRTLRDHCIFGLYTLNFHLRSHAVEGLQTLCTMFESNPTPSDPHSMISNMLTVRSWGRRDTCMNEKVRRVGCRIDWAQPELKVLSFGRKKEAENARSIKCWRMGHTLWTMGKGSLLSILSVLRDRETLEEVLPFVKAFSVGLRKICL